jgi:hypothetical protein
MEFLKKLPSSAVVSPDGEQFSFDDGDGRQRHGYRMNITEPGRETVICNVPGTLLERALDRNGELDTHRAIHLFPEVAKLLARHEQSQKISFTAHIKQAHYQYQEDTGKVEQTCKVVVYDKRNTSKTFSGTDRQATLNKALAWMENLDEATLHIKVETKPVLTRKLVSKDHYEGRKNLTHVEVELHLEYLTEVNGWIVLPVGM